MRAAVAQRESPLRRCRDDSERRRPVGADQGSSSSWPAWVQRCGTGSACDCDGCAGMPVIQRDIADTTAAGGGRLDSPTRARMERALSADFSSVRVHTGVAAHGLTSRLNARALTAGGDILFSNGTYRPGTDAGDRLLAHELTHVVQQRQGIARKPLDGGRTDPLEREADAVADQVVATGEGGGPTLTAGPVSMVQRDVIPHADDPVCVGRQHDFSRVGPAGPIEGLQREIAEITAGTDPAAALTLLDRIWSHGVAAAQIYIYEYLKQLWLLRGPSVVGQFVDELILRITQNYPLHRFADDPAVKRAVLIGGTVSLQHQRLNADARGFLSCYEDAARQTGAVVLDTSEERVLGEVKHYFGSELAAELMFGPDEDASEIVDETSRRALGVAAEGLVKRRNAVIAANAAYRGSVRNHYLTLAQRKPVEDEHVRAGNDYEAFRRQALLRFPVLEDFSAPGIDDWDEDAEAQDTEGEQLTEIAGLARGGQGSGALRTLVNRIIDKLKGIGKVREELKPGGEVNIWKVPRIVESTTEVTQAGRGTFHGKLVEDKLEQENREPTPSLTSRLIEYLEIALYLLAPFTEGLTLIPAIAITTARVGSRVYEHWKEYQTQKALHNTDFGAAALSDEDPSLLWLGADIAAGFIEVGLSWADGAALFRELAPAARAARAARAGDEAVAALEATTRDLSTAKLGAEKADVLARRVAADARAAQHGTAGMSADEAVRLEAEAITRGHPPGRVPPKSAEQGELLASSSVIDDGSALSQAQRDAELDLVARSDPQPSSTPGYRDEVDLGNGHVWRRRDDDTWCRFSPIPPSLCGTRIAGARSLRGPARVGTLPPFNYRIVRVDDLSQLPRDAAGNIAPLPDGVIYEFPGGHRAWRDGEAIRHETVLGPSTRRQGTEREMFTAGETGLPEVAGMQRAHTLGQGTGFESPFGILLAPEEVNQIIQNNGIEEFFRGLQESAMFGEAFEVSTLTIPHPGSLRLKEIRYQVSLSRYGQGKDRMFEYVITVGDGPNPAVNHFLADVSTNPEMGHYFDLVDVPERLRTRFQRFFANRRRR